MKTSRFSADESPINLEECRIQFQANKGFQLSQHEEALS